MRLLLALLICFVCSVGWCEEKLNTEDKMFSMIFDLHSEQMGYERTEQICGFGNSLAQVGFAIYKGEKYYPDEKGFIIINTGVKK